MYYAVNKSVLSWSLSCTVVCREFHTLSSFSCCFPSILTAHPKRTCTTRHLDTHRMIQVWEKMFVSFFTDNVESLQAECVVDDFPMTFFSMKSLESFLCTFALLTCAAGRRRPKNPSRYLGWSAQLWDLDVGSRNLSDITQLWDLGLSHVLCTDIVSWSIFSNVFSDTNSWKVLYFGVAGLRSLSQVTSD